MRRRAGTFSLWPITILTYTAGGYNVVLKRIKVIMPSGHIRASLVAAFAVIFGIVQLVCACMDMTGTEAAASQSHMSHQMSAGDQVHHAMVDMDAQERLIRGHGEHEHKADCSHCDDTAVPAATVDATPYIFTKPATLKTHYYDLAADTRADITTANLAGLRWLDSPRRLPGLDPVTLNTRSLI